MFRARARSQPQPALLHSPLWADLLTEAQARICGARQIKGAGPSSLDATASAVARAHSRLLVALERGASASEDPVWQPVSEAVELLIAVARVGATFRKPGHDSRGWLADQLHRRLACHEQAILAGEVTYNVWPEQAEQPAGRMRQAIVSLARDASKPDATLVSLRVASVDLAALLIRIAANTRASGLARDAPEPQTTTLTSAVQAIISELTARPSQPEPPPDKNADIVAHHLTAALRVRLPPNTPADPTPTPPTDSGVPARPAGLRNSWVMLATHQYAAITALDAQLDKPTYTTQSARLQEAIAQPTNNVICGARLLTRPHAFHHQHARRQQTTALTHALEAYIAGLRGHHPSLAKAQAITFTRLIRATVATTTIDLARAHPPTNTN